MSTWLQSPHPCVTPYLQTTNAQTLRPIHLMGISKGVVWKADGFTHDSPRVCHDSPCVCYDSPRVCYDSPCVCHDFAPFPYPSASFSYPSEWWAEACYVSAAQVGVLLINTCSRCALVKGCPARCPNKSRMGASVFSAFPSERKHLHCKPAALHPICQVTPCAVPAFSRGWQSWQTVR